jgi:glycosyltransferase involved in cell wall biosynthesis
MHLLLIITDYGSFNNFLSELVIKMVEDGHKIDVICSNEKVIDFADRDNFQLLGINVHFTDFPRGFNIFKQILASIKINKLIEQIDPDLVHAHFTTGIFTTILSKKPHYPMIGTIHGLGYPMLQGVKRQIFKSVELFSISRLDRVLVLNQFDRDILDLKSANKPILLESAGLGCDLNRFDINRFLSKVSDLKESLGISPNDFVITFTGRFVHFKGFDLVIKSFLKLDKLNPSSFKLILIGGRDTIHPTGLTKIEEEKYSSSSNIINVGFTNEVEKYLAIADVFLFPSLKEGMPVCIIEALAMGVPVIAADSRGCNDLVIDGVNGRLLSNKPSTDEIVNAITILKNSPETLQRFKDFALGSRYKLSRDIFIEKQIEDYTNLSTE